MLNPFCTTTYIFCCYTFKDFPDLIRDKHQATRRKFSQVRKSGSDLCTHSLQRSHLLLNLSSENVMSLLEHLRFCCFHINTFVYQARAKRRCLLLLVFARSGFFFHNTLRGWPLRDSLCSTIHMFLDIRQQKSSNFLYKIHCTGSFSSNSMFCPHFFHLALFGRPQLPLIFFFNYVLKRGSYSFFQQ